MTGLAALFPDAVSAAVSSAASAAAEQQPTWPGPVAAVRRELSWLPCLVEQDECADLQTALGSVARREAVVIQGGDCAERFAEADRTTTHAKVAQLQTLGTELHLMTGIRAVTIGRMAGQYAKPRSSPWEQAPGGDVVPSYRGDAINDSALARRTADPRRLLLAYECAASVIDAVRSTWRADPAGRVYVSHEALLLDYEGPLVRRARSGLYASSGHLVWIGDRTRRPDGPHVALAAGITNPVAVKIGPSASPAEMAELARRLNPSRIEGRLTFVVRLGAARITDLLPPIVEAVTRAGIPVVWLSDPMHGNTIRAAAGLKTRALTTIEHEITQFVRVLQAHRQWPGGLHLELTPDDVTECVSTPDAAPQASLPRYRSACDPRLDPDQAAQVTARFTALV